MNTRTTFIGLQELIINKGLINLFIELCGWLPAEADREVLVHDEILKFNFSNYPKHVNFTGSGF